ncbi:hypothetical protein ABXS69_01915 [Actinomyces timonensis]|uniref:Leucine-zipper of insertion element IS481 n=1 Tax=Actinomyces timonensis TaxID=1288391 RepID=A0AAU8N6B6_9ACTO
MRLTLTRLPPERRLVVARLVVDNGAPVPEAAAQVSWPTVKRWADRYRGDEPPITRLTNVLGQYA